MKKEVLLFVGMFLLFCSMVALAAFYPVEPFVQQIINIGTDVIKQKTDPNLLQWLPVGWQLAIWAAYEINSFLPTKYKGVFHTIFGLLRANRVKR
jgi:hypothetical protein